MQFKALFGMRSKGLRPLSLPAIWGFWDTLCLCFIVSGVCLLFLGLVIGAMFPALAFVAALAMVLIGIIQCCLGRLGLACVPRKVSRPTFACSAETGYPAIGQGTPITFRQFSDRLHHPQ